MCLSFLNQKKYRYSLYHLTKKTTLNPISGSKLLFIIVAAVVIVIIIIYIIAKLCGLSKNKKKKSIIIPENITEEKIKLNNGDELMKNEIENEDFGNIDD